MADRSSDPASDGLEHSPSSDGTSHESTSHETPHRSRPEWVSVVIEFFTMSRATLLLLIAFVLVAALYGVVRQDPVVAINTPPRPDPTQSETTGTDTTGTQTTETTDPTPTEQSTEPTDPTVTSETSGVEDSQTSTPGQSRLFERQQGPDDQGGEGQQTQQSPGTAPGQQPQQSAPPQQLPRQTQVPTT